MAHRKIEDFERQLERGFASLQSANAEAARRDLAPLCPPGYRLRVELRDAKGRKKRRNASIENWSPLDGEIRLILEPDSGVTDPPPDTEFVPRPADMEELVRTLNRVETRPGLSFVALKWFRDKVLPSQVPAWAGSLEIRDAVLQRAIETGIVLTRKVPNPLRPAVPTTAISLNQSHPLVENIGVDRKGFMRFSPLDLPGRPLSEIVLEDRT